MSKKLKRTKRENTRQLEHQKQKKAHYDEELNLKLKSLSEVQREEKRLLSAHKRSWNKAELARVETESAKAEWEKKRLEREMIEAFLEATSNDEVQSKEYIFFSPPA